jgi:thioesterase domain-containing protein
MYESENLELKVFKKLEDIYLKAYKNYQITPYEKDIILFYAKEHYFFWDKENDVKFKRVTLDDQTKNQWKHYVKSITMYEVEGEHSTIFYRENAKEFARLVQRHLDISK